MPAWLCVPTGPVCAVKISVLYILRQIHHRRSAAKVHKYIILPKYSASWVNKWQTFILRWWAPWGETLVRWRKIYNRLLMGNHVAWNQVLRTVLQRIRELRRRIMGRRFLNDVSIAWFILIVKTLLVWYSVRSEPNNSNQYIRWLRWYFDDDKPTYC